MDALTIGEIVAAVVIVNTLWSFLEKLIEKITKPHKDLESSTAALKEQHNKDILALNERIDALEESNKEQSREIASISADTKILIRTNMDMMEHMVTGNHQTAMKKTIKELENYLIERK